jgi:hypothetical protein
MTPFRMLVSCTYLLAGSWLGAQADEPAKEAKPPLTELSQEVSALQALYTLNLTRPQMETLRKLAGETASRPPKAADVKASAKFRKALTDLRDALVTQPPDDDRVENLSDRVNDLRDAEQLDLDDGVEVTDEAVERATEVLKLLTARQVAGYVATVADDIGDPLESLQAALDQAKAASAEQWAQLRDETADEVSQLVGGLDAEKAGRVRDQVVQFLIVARSLKPDEFKAQRPALEKKARQIVGDLGPTEVLRHVMEHALAELLSNPQLPRALDRRLK